MLLSFKKPTNNILPLDLNRFLDFLPTQNRIKLCFTNITICSSYIIILLIFIICIYTILYTLLLFKFYLYNLSVTVVISSL